MNGIYKAGCLDIVQCSTNPLKSPIAKGKAPASPADCLLFVCVGLVGYTSRFGQFPHIDFNNLPFLCFSPPGPVSPYNSLPFFPTIRTIFPIGPPQFHTFHLHSFLRHFHSLSENSTHQNLLESLVPFGSFFQQNIFLLLPFIILFKQFNGWRAGRGKIYLYFFSMNHTPSKQFCPSCQSRGNECDLPSQISISP